MRHHGIILKTYVSSKPQCICALWFYLLRWLKLKSLKTELESKLSDAEDEILNELEKVKLLAETASTHTEVEASIPLSNTVGSGDPTGGMAGIGSSGYSNPADAFKVRNQIQEMWKSLRLDIAHRKRYQIINSK